MNEINILTMINKYKCCLELKSLYCTTDYENIDILIKIITISEQDNITLREASIKLLQHKEKQNDYEEDHFLILCSTMKGYIEKMLKRKLLLN